MGTACVKSQRDNGRGGEEEDSEDERGPSKTKQNKRVKVLLLGTFHWTHNTKIHGF